MLTTYSADELDESEDESAVNARQTRNSFMRNTNSRPQRRKQMGLDGTYSSSDGSEPEDDAYTPSKKKSNNATVKKTPTKDKAIVISDSEDEPALSLPTRSNRSSSKKQKPTTLSVTSEDEIVPSNMKSSRRCGHSTLGSPSIASNSRVRGKRTAPQGESDSEKDIRSSPTRRTSRQFTPDEDEDEDEDEIVRPSPRKRRPQPTEESEEESQPVISPLKRARRPVDSDESDIVSSPLKRRRNFQHEVELSSDSDLPSPRRMAANVKRDTASKTPPRFTRQQKTARRHRTEKEKKMELLKRRRAGENIEQVTDSSESETDEEDRDEELQELSEFEDEEPSPENDRKSAKSKTRKRASGNVNDSDDFITDDEEGPLGVPLLAQIPIEFTAAAHKPIKEHFRDVIEWMVHNKINPGFDWQDPVYETAFRKVDAECGGFADSKFVSTQWTNEFTKAIYARPHLEIRKLNPGEGLDVLGEAKCEACNHRKHHPSFALQLKGNAYNKVTLEDIEPDSDEDSDLSSNDSSSEGSSKVSRDEKGQTLLGEDKQWFAGR